MAILLDEIQQAIMWSRPSVLIAVHQSKSDQDRVMSAMDANLDNIQVQVEMVSPEIGVSNILRAIAQKLDSLNKVFFVRGLGTQSLQYDGLNLYREELVEQKLKMVLWLTLEEVALLSHKAPDFWAFRHRVIEFPTKRSSRKNSLPSGVLLWHHETLSINANFVYDKIAFYKTLLRKFPPKNETVPAHVDAISNLAYCYWIVGDNQEVFDLLYQEIDLIKEFKLNEAHSILLNALAINSFDQKEYSEAFKRIEQAVELNPYNSLLRSNFGIICRSVGQSRKSFPSLKKAVRLAPNSPESWGIMGYLYMSLGKYESAFPLFKKALDLYPENIHFYPALAVCHSQMGNIEEFNKVAQQISGVARDNEYLALYIDGLLGNETAIVEKIRTLASSGKPMQSFIRRDPNLRFILSPAALREIF